MFYSVTSRGPSCIKRPRALIRLAVLPEVRRANRAVEALAEHAANLIALWRLLIWQPLVAVDRYSFAAHDRTYPSFLFCARISPLHHMVNPFTGRMLSPTIVPI